MSSPETPPEMTEEEYRLLEEQLEKITIDDVLLQTIVSLLNLGATKAGLGGGPASAAPDFEQLRQAIEAARALVPLLEARHADKLAPVKDMLAQLQMVYAQNAQGAAAPASGGGENPPEPPPAGPSGRIWVPGR